METGLLIRQLREEKGMTQKELAAAANINQATLSRYESGKPLAVDTILAISAAFGGAPELILSVCSKCPAMQVLTRIYNMPSENDLVIEQMQVEHQKLTTELQQLRENQPVENSPDYNIYVAQVKQIMNRISISAAAYSRFFGTREK